MDVRKACKVIVRGHITIHCENTHNLSALPLLEHDVDMCVVANLADFRDAPECLEYDNNHG